MIVDGDAVLRHYRAGTASTFEVALLDAFFCADEDNWHRLAVAFPEIRDAILTALDPVNQPTLEPDESITDAGGV